jgi:hypothetical protein
VVTTVVVRLRVELRGQTGSDEVEGVTRSARDDARARTGREAGEGVLIFGLVFAPADLRTSSVRK